MYWWRGGEGGAILGRIFNIMRKKNRKSLPRRVNKDFIQKIIFKSPA